MSCKEYYANNNFGIIFHFDQGYHGNACSIVLSEHVITYHKD